MTQRRRVVVITGASSGIGRATAVAFATSRACLVLASRRGDALDEVAAECEALGADAIAVVTDVSDNKQVKALAKRALARFGRIDVWVNDAAVGVYGDFLDIPLDDIRRVIDVDVMGYVYGSRAALKAMRDQGAGAIVNVASVVGEVPQPYAAPYAMAKAAVRALGVSLRQELVLAKLAKISVSTVLPPTIDTPFFRHAANYTGREVVAMPPVYAPEKVAAAIVHASLHPRGEIVVGALGNVFVRGHRRHPRLLDAQMAVQTKHGQFSRRQSENTAGILYAPAPTDDGAIVGGWDGARRMALRKAMFAALVLGAGAIVVARSRGRTGR